MAAATQAEEILSKNQYVAKVIPIQIRKDTRGVSRSLPEDPFESFYNKGGIIEPPYDLFTLAMMPEASSELGPAIEAMVVNIEKLGHRVVPRDGMRKGEDALTPQVKQERAKINNFFLNASLEPNQTFTSLRESWRYDLETTGNAYIEVIPIEISGDPGGLNHLPSWQMRLRKEDDYYTDHDVKRSVQQADGSWKIESFPYRKRFRRFVQIRENKTESVYFKEWGDPRDIDSRTGEEVSDEVRGREDWDDSYLATSVIHLKLYCSRSPYGIPRWIGNLFTIFGNRAAEVINYTTFRSNNIPAMMLMATNVQLTEASIERIQKFVEERIQGDDNYSTILLVEGEPISEGMKDPGTMKLDVKELTQVQHTDALFVNYMERNDDKIRRAFRLPPLFMGRCVPIDTEFLTVNGWKSFGDIRDDEKVATVNNNGELQYQIPSKRYEYDYDGDLVRVTNGRAIDAVVTPNHRMMQRDHRSACWGFEEAQHLKKWHREFMLAALDWCGEQQDTMSIPRVPRKNECDLTKSKNISRDVYRKVTSKKLYEQHSSYSMNLFLEFLGYFVSEGSTTDVRGPITLSQNIGQLATRMLDVVTEMGFNVASSEYKERQATISFSDVSLWMWLRENCGAGSANKRFPRWVFDLPKEQLRILYNALMDGDGSWCTRGRDGSGCYSTTSQILADQFQELCFKLGFRSTSRHVVPEEENWSEKWVITVSGNPINHCCDIHGMIESVEYRGKVCCFTTPNGTIVTRHNGHIIVSGNSDDYTRSTADSSRKVAEEQVFKPQRNHEDTIWNQTVVAALDAANVLFKSNTPDVTDNYELTQLLAVAERSGGLSPFVSRAIVEDVLGRDLPELSAEIPHDIPFTLTMLREQIAIQAQTEGMTTGDVAMQLRELKGMMNNNADITEENHAQIDTLIKLMEIDDGLPKLTASTTNARSEKRTELETVFKASEEQRIVGGVVLVPGVVDLQGDIYDEDTTAEAGFYWLEHYQEDPKENGIKFMHEGEVIYDAARPIQSFVLDRDMEFEVEVPAAGDDHPAKELTTLTYPKGTWILYARIRDDVLWEKFKAGEIAGWSIGGVALVQQLKRMNPIIPQLPHKHVSPYR